MVFFQLPHKNPYIFKDKYSKAKLELSEVTDNKFFTKY